MLQKTAQTTAKRRSATTIAASSTGKGSAPISASVPQNNYITSEANLAAAIDALTRIDPAGIGHMLEIAGLPPLRARPATLHGLVWIIVSQQVSTASARAIFARVEAKFGDVDHRQLLAATDEDLRACGLSAPKMRTLRSLAAAIADESLDIAELPRLDIDTARAKMTAVKGIGPWTADIFLLFCIGHPDIWPAGDLALQEGVRLALRMRKRPDAVRLEKLSQRWQPHRAAAARLIWAYYGRMLELKRQTS